MMTRWLMVLWCMMWVCVPACDDRVSSDDEDLLVDVFDTVPAPDTVDTQEMIVTDLVEDVPSDVGGADMDTMEDLDASLDMDADTDVDVTPAGWCGGGELVLDPGAYEFVELPTGAIRYAMSGFHDATGTCLWMRVEGIFPGALEGFCGSLSDLILDATAEPLTASLLFDTTLGGCENSGFLFNPPTTPTQAVVESLVGCFGPSTSVPWNGRGPFVADLRVRITPDVPDQGPTTCDVVFDNHDEQVILGLDYVGSQDESIYLQVENGARRPSWVRVLDDTGQAVGEIFQGCFSQRCDAPTIDPCLTINTSALDITEGGREGHRYIAWEGRFHTLDPARNCYEATPAAPGMYTLEVCYGTRMVSLAPNSEMVADVVCEQKLFRYPSPSPVIIQAPERRDVLCEAATGDYGACRASLGFAFDGVRCREVSGCSCDPDCDAFYPSKEACEDACFCNTGRFEGIFLAEEMPVDRNASCDEIRLCLADEALDDFQQIYGAACRAEGTLGVCGDETPNTCTMLRSRFDLDPDAWAALCDMSLREGFERAYCIVWGP